jgi:hypothetical protein
MRILVNGDNNVLISMLIGTKVRINVNRKIK